MKTEIKKHLQKIAASFRKRNPELPSGGFVIIYGGKAAGWTDSIQEPRGWVPGCYAVPENESEPIYDAIGGNEMDGCEKWSPAR